MANCIVGCNVEGLVRAVLYNLIDTRFGRGMLSCHNFADEEREICSTRRGLTPGEGEVTMMTGFEVRIYVTVSCCAYTDL